MRTLQECKDEVARKYNGAFGAYKNWDQMETVLCAKSAGVRNLFARMEEAAELYASSRTEGLQKEIEELRSGIKKVIEMLNDKGTSDGVLAVYAREDLQELTNPLKGQTKIEK